VENTTNLAKNKIVVVSAVFDFLSAIKLVFLNCSCWRASIFFKKWKFDTQSSEITNAD